MRGAEMDDYVTKHETVHESVNQLHFFKKKKKLYILLLKWC